MKVLNIEKKTTFEVNDNIGEILIKKEKYIQIFDTPQKPTKDEGKKDEGKKDEGKKDDK